MPGTVRIILSCLLLIILSGCKIEEQANIPAVAQLALVDAASIKVTARTGDDYNDFYLRTTDMEPVEQAIIKIGEAFSISDRYHMHNQYKLLRIEDGMAIFDATFTFNAISFGGEVTTENKTIAVAPYSEKIQTSNNPDAGDL